MTDIMCLRPLAVAFGTMRLHVPVSDLDTELQSQVVNALLWIVKTINKSMDSYASSESAAVGTNDSDMPWY
jgi:hypothetical protein